MARITYLPMDDPCTVESRLALWERVRALPPAVLLEAGNTVPWFALRAQQTPEERERLHDLLLDRLHDVIPYIGHTSYGETIQLGGNTYFRSYPDASNHVWDGLRILLPLPCLLSPEERCRQSLQHVLLVGRTLTQAERAALYEGIMCVETALLAWEQGLVQGSIPIHPHPQIQAYIKTLCGGTNG